MEWIRSAQLREQNEAACDDMPEKNIKLLSFYLTREKEAEQGEKTACLTHNSGETRDRKIWVHIPSNLEALKMPNMEISGKLGASKAKGLPTPRASDILSFLATRIGSQPDEVKSQEF